MVRAIATAAFLVSLRAACAQSPAFDVASVRQNREGGRAMMLRENVQASPDSVTIRNANLRAVIAWAYHVMEYQITGPDWMNFERYDIAAKAAGAVPEAQLRRMLQKLLAERFKLSLHRETKDLPAYVMTVAKNGPKFRESQEDGDFKIEPNQKALSVTVHRLPASRFVEELSRFLKAPVLNQTGLNGTYDVTVSFEKYLPDHNAAAALPDPFPILMTVMQEELGLKLESRKVPLDLLVIDHAEKVPTEN